MTASNPKMHIQFNCLLDESTDKMLEELKSDLQLPKAHIIRTAVRQHHAMRFHRKPLCADGQVCRMPQAHVWPTQPQVPEQQAPTQAHAAS